MVYVYAVPFTPPPPAPDPWPGVRHVWTGWDGSQWDLGARRSGVFLRGARGMTLPAYARYTATSAAIAGTRHRGSRALEKDVFWDLGVYAGRGTQEWLDYDRAFWATMDPERPGSWSLTQPNGQTRTLRLRFAGDDDPLLRDDPSALGWAQYGVTLVADFPFWTGAPVSRRFAADAPAAFFPGPPFTISEGSLATSASIANPGDEPAWPTWWVSGVDEATVGVGARVVVVPFEVAADRLLVVDTRPVARTAVEIDAPPAGLAEGEVAAWVASRLPSGVDRTRELGAATKFGPVPPAESAALSVNLVGAGWAQASIVPAYRRPW